MQVTRRSLLLGGLAAMALSGCNTSRAEPLTGNITYEQLPLTTSHVPGLVTASLDLMWQLMLLGNQEDNTVASPSSLVSALALLGLGATGDSATSFDQVFGMGAEERAAAANALRTAMTSHDALPEKVDAKNPPATPILHQASHLLILDEIPVNQAFLDRATQYFDSAVERVVRSSAKANLDAWVNRHTAGLIEKSAIEVTRDTRLVIQDAILFAAAWQTQFDQESSIDFHRLDGSSIPTEGISQTFDCAHAELDGWQAVRLPYTDAFRMDVILPPTGTSPYRAETSHLMRLIELLDADHRPPRGVEVSMPTLDVHTTLDLRTLLTRHGMDLGSFEGIFARAAVEDARQQARLQVTAKGTVGAAVTEISMMEVSAPINDALPFVVDRPYLIDITAEATGWSLFLAVITDPSVKE